jgi:hypothetical protein
MFPIKTVLKLKTIIFKTVLLIHCIFVLPRVVFTCLFCQVPDGLKFEVEQKIAYQRGNLRKKLRQV